MSCGILRMFILTLGQQYVQVAYTLHHQQSTVILITGKTWKPPIQAPCGDTNGAGSVISLVYLWQEPIFFTCLLAFWMHMLSPYQEYWSYLELLMGFHPIVIKHDIWYLILAFWMHMLSLYHEYWSYLLLPMGFHSIVFHLPTNKAWYLILAFWMHILGYKWDSMSLSLTY